MSDIRIERIYKVWYSTGLLDMAGGEGEMFYAPRIRRKKGIYFGKVKHTYRHWEKPNAVQMALVRFDGNEWSSRVPYNELRFEENSNDDT